MHRSKPELVESFVTGCRSTGRRPVSRAFSTIISGPVGFLGIITQGKLRSSHATSLNDYGEFLHAVEMVHKRAKQELYKADFLDKAFFDGVAKQTEKLEVVDIPGVFVACFSQEKNDLSQWRCYGEGEGGLALGFDFNELRCIAEARFYRGPFRVIYEDSEKWALIDDLLAWGLSIWRARYPLITPENREECASSWAARFLNRIAPLAPLLKNSAFKQEKEWRLILFGTREEATVGAGNRGLYGYVEADLRSPMTGCLPLRELWVGPGPFPDRQQLVATVALQQKGYENVAYWRAGITYRK